MSLKRTWDRLRGCTYSTNDATGRCVRARKAVLSAEYGFGSYEGHGTRHEGSCGCDGAYTKPGRAMRKAETVERRRWRGDRGDGGKK